VNLRICLAFCTSKLKIVHYYTSFAAPHALFVSYLKYEICNESFRVFLPDS
jgi:hypothetical protein